MNATQSVTVILALLSSMVLVTANRATSADAHAERLKALFDVRQPAGSSPFPAVVLVSGCSGFDAKLAKGAYDRVNAKLVERGFVTIRVDYVGARGATNCQSPTPIAKDRVADDIMVGVKHLHTLSFVDTKKINLLG
jgi:dienelactone hydrolase